MGANCCRVVSEQSLKGKKEANSLESNPGERVSSVKCHIKSRWGQWRLWLTVREPWLDKGSPQARKMGNENVPGGMKSPQGTCSQQALLSLTQLQGKPRPTNSRLRGEARSLGRLWGWCLSANLL